MKKTKIVIITALFLIAVMATGLNAQVDTLLLQGFESTPFPPTNWYQVINNTTINGYPCTWYQGNYSSTQFHHGSYGAYIWWSNSVQDEWLVTPQLNLSGYQANTHQIFLRFSSAFYRTTATSVHNYICASSNNGAAWQDTIDDPIHTVPGSGWVYINDAPNPLEYDISDHIGQTIRIGWNYYYNGGGGSRGVWSVDDVLVTAKDTTSSGPSGDLDLEMVSIYRPNTEELAGEAFKPSCKIYNNISDTVLADVLCRFTDLSDMDVKYEKVVSDFPLEPGYSTVGAFPNFTPEGGKEYKALFVVTNPDDINHNNDNLEKRWSAVAGIDVTPIEILAPAENQVNAFAPSAKYAERAGKATPATLICQIEDVAFHSVIYSDSMSHDFAGSDTFTATFANAPMPADGMFTIKFWAENPLDGSNISKPEMMLAFTYTGIEEKPEPRTYTLSATGSLVNFSLARPANVSLKVYDAAGNVVATLASGSMTAGPHQATWNARPGVYFVKLVTPEYSNVCKAIVLR
jgi:hypothetical protein